MARLVRRNVENLSEDLYKKCYSLNFRENGYMQESLVTARRWPNAYKSKAYMLLDSDDKLLSWALVRFRSHDETDKNSTAHFYTRKNCRNKGYASRVFKAIEKDYDKDTLITSPHDEKSVAFFEKVGM